MCVLTSKDIVIQIKNNLLVGHRAEESGIL